MKPNTPGADSTMQYMGGLDACAANVVHQNIIANAFACDITRVACLQYGNDQKLMVNAPGPACPTTISTAASSTAARPATSPTW